MKKILFVCTGNTCRSPMAEALFKKLLKERNLHKNFEVGSAGVYAFEHDPASYEAISVMQEEYGTDISSHRARVLTDTDIKENWLILTMTEHHREMILDIYPEGADKVFTIKEYAGADDENPDISDPFGMDYDTYKYCAEEIEGLLLKIIDKLVEAE